MNVKICMNINVKYKYESNGNDGVPNTLPGTQ